MESGYTGCSEIMRKCTILSIKYVNRAYTIIDLGAKADESVIIMTPFSIKANLILFVQSAV